MLFHWRWKEKTTIHSFKRRSGDLRAMSRRYDRIAAWLLPRKRGAHIAVVLLTLLMIPGAMTALQPIDMESYEMESPELTAQTIVNEEFPNAEIILGFLVSARNPDLVPAVED